jgi:dolichol-phosphate mannosyltransferase
MVKAWQRGEKLVLAVRANREESRFRKWTSWVFYAAMRKFAIATVPTGGFDYFLMDRVLLDMMLAINERNVFLQGQVLWPGVKPFEIPYVRRPRLKGKSQWKLGRKFSYFLDGFTAYSAFPLRLAAWFGAGFCVLACLSSAALVIQRIFYGTEIVGWTSLMIVILLMGGIQMLTIGILGEYLWRTLEQTRVRPMYLVKQVLTQGDRNARPAAEPPGTSK